MAGTQTANTINGGSTTVTTSSNAFANVPIGAKITANSLVRYVVAKASSTSITVNQSVDLVFKK